MKVIEQPVEKGVTSWTTYNFALAYLRAFLVVLVVAHHAALAYFPYAPPRPNSLLAQPRFWQAFPVVDTHKWNGAIQFVGFNDVFFMSLMFFVSGLFVWQGLVRKGPGRFLRDRMIRLGIPFIVSVLVLAPLAYFPSYLQTLRSSGEPGFIKQWASLGTWPAGPAWFVWMLLVFDCIAAGLFAGAPRWGKSLGRVLSVASHRPVVLFCLLIVVSSTAYIPMALAFNSGSWAAWGPFTFQTSRIIHYLVYFVIGVGFGASGVGQGFLSPDGRLARRWFLWVAVAVVVFLTASAITMFALTKQVQSVTWSVCLNSGFVWSCAASSFAFLAIFTRFTRSRNRIFDSLDANSYAIYLFHYSFVSWLQYVLLRSDVSGVAKVVICFAGALALSWTAAIAIRRLPGVNRII